MNDKAPEPQPTAPEETPEAPTLLLPCPCGKEPSTLLIEMPERAKYGVAMGDCCGTWMVEFRNGYARDPNITTKKAREAWNDAPRPA